MIKDNLYIRNNMKLKNNNIIELKSSQSIIIIICIKEQLNRWANKELNRKKVKEIQLHKEQVILLIKSILIMEDLGMMATVSLKRFLFSNH